MVDPFPVRQLFCRGGGICQAVFPKIFNCSEPLKLRAGALPLRFAAPRYFQNMNRERNVAEFDSIAPTVQGGIPMTVNVNREGSACAQGPFAIQSWARRACPGSATGFRRACSPIRGYGYAPYSSLESIIEASKQNYHVALHTTQNTLQSEAPNRNVWLSYFSRSLVRQVRNLRRKVEHEHLLRTMPEISMRVIELINRSGPVSIAGAEEALRVNKYTLRSHFRRLVQEGYLIQLGRARATKYALASP